jgi:hypothetical protein
MLPESVLERLSRDMMDYKGTGIGVLELAPDSRHARQILVDAEEALRRLLNIPQNYRVIFFDGSVFTQYSAIPLNLLSEHNCADYVISGRFSKLAELEAKRYGDIAIAASSGGATPPFTALPKITSSNFRPDADYAHICFNDSVYGTKFYEIPDTGSIPLVADMSSCLLSEPVNVSRFGLIYASSEMNICPPAMTLIIVRDDLMGKAIGLLSQSGQIFPYMILPCDLNIKSLADWMAEYTEKYGIGGNPAQSHVIAFGEAGREAYELKDQFSAYYFVDADLAEDESTIVADANKRYYIDQTDDSANYRDMNAMYRACKFALTEDGGTDEADFEYRMRNGIDDKEQEMLLAVESLATCFKYK